MGYTLNELLDETGVSGLNGSSAMKKTASEKPSFSKLAERCRFAADATVEERAEVDQQSLAEKTAAIAVISRTLDEIRSIEGGELGVVKTAAPRPARTGFDVEVFIKTALDAGHPPDKIAAFLEKQGGLLSRIGGRIDEARATSALESGRNAARKGDALKEKSLRLWQDRVRKAEALGEPQRDAVVSRMRVNLGDDNAAMIVGDHPAYKNLPSAKGLKKPAPAAAPAAAGRGGIGGTGVTKEQLGKLKKPAAYAGAGFLGSRALSGSGDDGDKKRGVVVVNS